MTRIAGVIAGGYVGLFMAKSVELYIAMLAILGLAFFGFLQYQRKQGNTVKVGNKKLN